MKSFNWNDDKNMKLILERGVSFEMAIRHIQNGEILDIIKHPNIKNIPIKTVI